MPSIIVVILDIDIWLYFKTSSYSFSELSFLYIISNQHHFVLCVYLKTLFMAKQNKKSQKQVYIQYIEVITGVIRNGAAAVLSVFLWWACCVAQGPVSPFPSSKPCFFVLTHLEHGVIWAVEFSVETQTRLGRRYPAKRIISEWTQKLHGFSQHAGNAFTTGTDILWCVAAVSATEHHQWRVDGRVAALRASTRRR